MTDPRLARPSWRGRTNVDALTISCIERAEAIVKAERPDIAHLFVVTQGSYQGDGGDPDSGTTHRLGGGVDLVWCGHEFCYLALRRAGMFIWHRYPWQGDWPDHFHGAPLDHPYMDYRLAAQQVSYLNGGNGLGGTDDGPRLNPIPRPVWPPTEEDDTMKPEDFDQIRTLIREEIDAALGDLGSERIASNKTDKGPKSRSLSELLFGLRDDVKALRRGTEG